MADEERAKAEKLAAAKKRVEEMKKKKKKAGAAAKKEKDASATKEDDNNNEPTTEAPEPETETEPAAAAADRDDEAVEEPSSPRQTASQQSKMRSASFRAASISGSPAHPGPLSPPADGETAADIYRKQVARIEDLEKENKRLANEAAGSEKRWQKAEEELTELKESDGKTGSSDGAELERLQAELTALQRQNAQLQSAAAKSRGHGPSPSVSTASPPSAELQAQLASKSATIETMELELSRLRAQAERRASEGGTDKEQIAALEEKLARAEEAASKASRELQDLKRNLERTSEKAIKESSSRTSAETKVRTLEQENETLTAEKEELQKKHDALDKKVAALGNLHKENDSRTQALRKEKEAAEKEVLDLKNKVEHLEADNARLRKKDAADGGGDDDGVDELEDEGRQRLEKKIRGLESEIYDLRRGIWHQKRRDMETGAEDLASPGGDFTNIDLSGPVSPNARKQSQQKGFGDFFASGLNALTGGTTPGGGDAGDDEGFLEDDDMEFDEDAFRKAQEEDFKRRIERIKEIKRGLKNWEGWRLDLVDSRRGGGYGIGEVFEI
ncbi:hypothetical protein BKA67DRAFT_561360 [Truncatella angustata]|uniref:M protein repeat protein n=1 Tax=Truncatella angustata TaxID=152316 RepID=A0A9P8UMZ0_9PEZI|nr:uncharacterized protein BKA67DRAFT_561360 [Truncatella angustata]KAH6655649.1 hypothetical protein BKA67DRAFT_561360 [Truncatella angustata]